MIAVPAGGRVLVWSSPVDFRKGMDGLCAYVQLTLKADAFAGDLFVFRSRRADRIKVLMYDGTGLCLYQTTWLHTASPSIRWEDFDAVAAWIAAARSMSWSHRLQCLTGGFAPGASYK